MRNSFLFIAAASLVAGASANTHGDIAPIGEQSGTIALGANGFATLPGLNDQLQTRRGIGLGQQGFGTTIGQQGASVPPMVDTPQFIVNNEGGFTPLGEQGGTIALGANGFATLPGFNDRLQTRRGIGLGQQGFGTTIGQQGASVPPIVDTPQFIVNSQGGAHSRRHQGSATTIGPQGSIAIGQQGSGTAIGPQSRGNSMGTSRAALAPTGRSK